MAVFIVSRSDIDDLVPILTAFQIEWNKLHQLLQNQDLYDSLLPYADAGDVPADRIRDSGGGFAIWRSVTCGRLQLLWQDEFVINLLLHWRSAAKKHDPASHFRFTGGLPPRHRRLVG